MKKRMYYEALEKILPDIKLYINTDDGINKLLPLDDLIPSASGGQTSGKEG